VQLLLPFSDYENIDPVKASSLSDHQYFLCESHVRAFILNDRVHGMSYNISQFGEEAIDIFKGELDVQGIHQPRFNMNAIDRLVMKTEGNKSLIKAICQSYRLTDRQPKRFSSDIIEGKGEGQIILLHGPPGTGKTLTAGEHTRGDLS